MATKRRKTREEQQHTVTHLSFNGIGGEDRLGDVFAEEEAVTGG